MNIDPITCFLTTQDLMRLEGFFNYKSANRRHVQIRDALSQQGSRKRRLTIKEYCDYEQLPSREIWLLLRPDFPCPYK